MAAVRGVNASNYVAAGRAATNNFINTVGAVFDNSPNYTKIGETKVREEAKTKIEAMKADALVAKAGIKAERDFRIAQYKLDSANSIVKAQESVRKAGVIAAASENIFDAFKKQREPFKPNFNDRQQYIDDNTKKYDTKTKEINAPGWSPADIIPPTKRPIPELGGWNYETGTPTSNSNSSSVKPQNISAPSAVMKTSANSSSSDIRSEMYSYLTTKHNLDRNQALGIMANVHRESSFNPFAPSGDDRGPGGLFQWKGVRQTPTVAALVKSGDWKGQIDYALNEPANLSAVTPGSFQNTRFKSPQEAADWWMTKWERPLDPKASSLVHTDFLSTYSNNNFI